MDWTIEIMDLTVGYETPIVNALNYRAKEGELVGILGSNGCGKSTLLGGICGANKIFSGHIYVAGEEITKLKPKRRAKNISLYSQRNEMMEGLSVLQVIELGCYIRQNFLLPQISHHQDVIMDAAHLFGIEYLLEKDCMTLSEGQRSLVFLSKTIAQDAKVILLDEPTAALDPYNTHLFFERITKYIKEKSKIGIIV